LQVGQPFGDEKKLDVQDVCIVDASGTSKTHEYGAKKDPAPATVNRKARGRPGVKLIAEQLFETRRKEGVPLAASPLQEATAIVGEWPPNSVPRPKPKTVSQHISRAWKEARRSHKLKP
jgi:hypothetical protein